VAGTVENIVNYLSDYNESLRDLTLPIKGRSRNIRITKQGEAKASHPSTAHIFSHN